MTGMWDHWAAQPGGAWEQRRPPARE